MTHYTALTVMVAWIYGRSQIRHPVRLDPEGYAKVCPKPKDWRHG